MRFWSLKTATSSLRQGMVVHPYIIVADVFMTFVLLFAVYLPFLPCLRQRIPWLSQGHLLLRQSFPLQGLRLTVCSRHMPREPRRGYCVPDLGLMLDEGSHCSPGL